jgi:hypothetical protein
MMCPAIDNAASCEIRYVIRFLHPKNTSAAEIQRELCAAHGKNVVSQGTLRQLCRMFKVGRTNVHDEEEVVGHCSVQSVDQKSVKDGASQFQNFYANFHKFHALFSTRLSQLG